jgi:hypothetical protein
MAFGATEIAGESITSSFLICLFVLKSSSSCGVATTMIAIRFSRELLSSVKGRGVSWAIHDGVVEFPV